jgi:uncharacterized protein YndB with AHSA1/START domain
VTTWAAAWEWNRTSLPADAARGKNVSDDEAIEIGWPRLAIAVGVGFAAGLLLVIAPYAVAWAASNPNAPIRPEYTMGLMAAFPFVQGLVAGLAMGRVRYTIPATLGVVAVLFTLEMLVGAVVLREGVICLIMAAPFVLGLMLAGAALGRVLAHVRIPRGVEVSLIPLVMLAVAGETAGPRPEHSNAVADSIVINAPPEYVWRYVVQYPENTTPPNYWLWAIGLPYPTQSVAEASRVGATRLCKFSGGYAFEERITDLQPNRLLRFAVTRQPDHPEITGHFRFDEGEIALSPNASGSTTITATSRYRLFVRPAAYFDLWTTDVTRQIHFRVLNRMKALAEVDYRRDHPGTTRFPS